MRILLKKDSNLVPLGIKTYNSPFKFQNLYNKPLILRIKLFYIDLFYYLLIIKNLISLLIFYKFI